MKKLFIVSIIALALVGCQAEKKTAKTTAENTTETTTPNKPATVGVPSPPTIIYKTKKDYSQNVPVGFKDKHITSYPAPSDLNIGGKLVTPTALNDGFWLDNRGISLETAFLSYTYKEYAALSTVPNDLYQRLLDTDPFIEVWDCGKRHTFENAEKEINQIIKEKNLDSRCTKIK